MTNSNTPNPESSDKGIDKIAEHIAEVTNGVLKAMNTEDCQPKTENLDDELEKANKLQAERKEILEVEYEQNKQRLIKRWKRY
jgi:patatin-like phospholipase/acyl hydrolase